MPNTLLNTNLKALKNDRLEKSAFLIFVTNDYEAANIEAMLKREHISYDKKYAKVSDNINKILGVSFYIENEALEQARTGISAIYDQRDYASIRNDTAKKGHDHYKENDGRRRKTQKRIMLFFLVTASFLLIAVEIMVYMMR